MDEGAHGTKRLSDGEEVGRVCGERVEDVLDGLPVGEDCVVCGRSAAYAHVPLVEERSAEGAVPYLVRDGDPTPIRCAERFGELTG